jgi:hypothetical protein
MSGFGSTTEVSSAKEQQPKNDIGDAVNNSKCVTIDILDVELEAIAGPFKLRRSQTLQKVFDTLRSGRGVADSFILKLGGRHISETDTPDSLGMKDNAELIYVPCVLIDIRYEESGAKECAVRVDRSHDLKMRRVYKVLRERKGKDAFILKLGEREVLETDTPVSLDMGEHEELTYVPCVLIGICDEQSRAIAGPFKLRRSQTLQQVYDAFVKSTGKEQDSFILKLGEESVGYWDTPDSLKMDDHVELTCVPDTNMACAEAEEDVSTIDIVFFNQVLSEINHVVLRHGYNEKMKTLFSRYAAMREIPLKSLRFKSDNKVLFLSSIGKMSPRDLGMQNNDVIYASRFESIGMKRNEIETTKKCRPSRGVRSKKGKAKSKKKITNQPSYSTMNEEERLRREHSKMLTIVFDEANPLFKEIRQKLNSLALEQTPPKVKLLSPRIRAKQPTSADLSDISSVSLDNKAIKTRFNVIVGEVGNLYKSTKPSKNIKAHEVSFTIDLHGYSKEAAVRELDASLPSWIDVAMYGDYPFVIPVTIICGAGGQVLSEVVEKWIRENERVANARKNMFV